MTFTELVIQINELGKTYLKDEFEFSSCTLDSIFYKDNTIKIEYSGTIFYKNGTTLNITYKALSIKELLGVLELKLQGLTRNTRRN